MACYDRLMQLHLFPESGFILDAGCGTGQISLPLAARGYHVLGMDVSQEMVDIAASKLNSDSNSHYAVADIRNIPEDDGIFDAVVVSKLFQHVQNWQGACREIVRVTKPGCFVIQINERGAFRNAVRRHFSRRADELGFTARFLGLNPHSGENIKECMMSLGCRVIPVDMSDLRWNMTISYGEAVERIRDRLFAEFWYLPTDIHDQLLAETSAWVEAQPNGRNTTEHLMPYLSADVFKAPEPR